MEIREEKYLNAEAFVLENEYIKLVQLKDFGAKIASIFYKEKEREILFQPTKKKYDMPKFGDDFSKYDTSGLDEMLPTIDTCVYPKSRIKLQDHGSVWSVPWKNHVSKSGLESQVVLEDLPLKLKRVVSLENRSILLSYTLYNLSEQSQYYLWALHGLMNFNDETELFFSKDIKSIVNVIDFKDYDFNPRILKEYPDKSENKFYFIDELNKGMAGINYLDDKFKLIMEYETSILKYLGVWVTKGGFKGEYNLAIEPATGYYDSLERAFENEKASKIMADDEISWGIKISFENY